MALPPDQRRPAQPEEEIIEAEWVEVQNDPNGSKGNGRSDLFTEIYRDLVRGVRNVAIALGVLLVLFVLFAPAPDANQPATTARPDEALDPSPLPFQRQSEATTSDNDWTPLMLCEDEQVLESVIAARREWLSWLLQDMAAEGSYIMPDSGDPIAEGVRHARITFPESNQALGMSETGGDIRNDAFLVRCSGTMEIRGAFKLPDGTWSDTYLTFPDARFDVRTGHEGFSLEFPDLDRELSTGVMHVAGAQLRLQEMREITTGVR